MRQRAIHAGQLNREKQRRKLEEAKTRSDDVRETGNQQGELGILKQGKHSTNQEEVITGTVNPSKGTQSETLAEQLVNRDHVVATKNQDDPKPLVTEIPLRGDQTKATKEKTPVVLEDTQRRESGGDLHIQDHQKDGGHNEDHQKDGGHKKKVRQTPEQQQTGRTRAATVPVAPKIKARNKDEQSNQKLPHVDPQTEHAQDVHEQPVPVIKKERPKSQNMHVHKGKQIKNQDMHHHKMGRNEIANEHGRSEHQPDIKALQHPHPSPVGRERAATAQI